MGPIGCPEMLVRNDHSALRKLSKERRSHLHLRGSLKSRELLGAFHGDFVQIEYFTHPLRFVRSNFHAMYMLVPCAAITATAFRNTLTTFFFETFSLAMSILISESPWGLLPVDPHMIKMLAIVTHIDTVFAM
jgi:hypothetical protein